MRTKDDTPPPRDYERIEKAILLLEENFQQQPSLTEMAKSVGLSEYHFQRLFSRWAGISPKRFVQFLTKENAKKLLRNAPNLLDATYEAGLSGPGRLHDLFVTCEAVTPGQYKNTGEGLTIHYGFHPTPFGDCCIAVTKRGICHLSFMRDADRAQAYESLRNEWRKASFQEDQAATQALIARIFKQEAAGASPLHLFLKGTNFQIKVWEALLKIPPGALVSYEDIARYMGNPRAARAVGSAVGKNPIAFIIPCHRVIRKIGEFGSYRYGSARKKALLGWEASKTGLFEKKPPPAA